MLRPNPRQNFAAGSKPGQSLGAGHRDLALTDPDRWFLPSVQDTLQKIHSGAANEPGHEDVHRIVVDPVRRVVLLQLSVRKYRDAIAERHRLNLIMGDVNRRYAQSGMESPEFRAHLHAKLGVQIGQGFVEEERLRVTNNGAAHRDALSLAAGKLLRFTDHQISEIEDTRDFAYPLIDLGSRQAMLLKREAHVLPYGHVRIEGVVLKDHRNIAIARRHVVDNFAVDLDLALREFFPGPQSFEAE